MRDCSQARLRPKYDPLRLQSSLEPINAVRGDVRAGDGDAVRLDAEVDYPPLAAAVLQRVAGGGLAIAATALAREEVGFPNEVPGTDAASYRQASPSTFVLATDRAPSDLDPHSAYDAGSGVAWQSGNLGHYCNRRVEGFLEQARTAGDATDYQTALSEIQQIVTRDDPAAIHTAQTHWLTVKRRDITVLAPNLVVGEIIDFYALQRADVSGSGWGASQSFAPMIAGLGHAMRLPAKRRVFRACCRGLGRARLTLRGPENPHQTVERKTLTRTHQDEYHGVYTSSGVG